MAHYDAALAWARLILDDESPLTGAGGHRAPSLLFPMEAVFEAFGDYWGEQPQVRRLTTQ